MGKGTIIIMLLAAFLAPGCRGTPSDATYQLKTEWKDKYLVTAGDLAYGDDVVQTVFNACFDGWFNIGTWHSVGPDGSWNNDFGDEIDYYSFLKIQKWGFDFEMGVWYFDMVSLLDVPKGDIFSPYFMVGRAYDHDGTRITPHFRVDAYYPTNGIWDRGSVSRAGTNIDFDLQDGLLLKSNAEIAYDDGAFGNNSGLFGDFNFLLEKRLLNTDEESLTWNILGYRLMVSGTSDRRESDQIFSSGLVLRWK